MKKQIGFFYEKTKNIIFVFLITLSACNDRQDLSNDVPLNNITYETSNYEFHDFDFYGQAHNDALDSIYNLYFANNFDYNSTSDTSAIEAITNITINYINIQNEITQNTYTADTTFIKQIGFNSINITDNDLVDLLDSSYFTPLQKIAINKMIDTINNATSIYQVHTNLENVAIYVENNLSEGEQIYVFMILSVAQHSTDYWTSTSGQTWVEKRVDLGNDQPLDLKGVIKADVLGAIAGLGRATMSGEALAVAINGAINGYLASGLNPTGALAGAVTAVLGVYGREAIKGAILGSAIYLIGENFF